MIELFNLNIKEINAIFRISPTLFKNRLKQYNLVNC